MVRSLHSKAGVIVSGFRYDSTVPEAQMYKRVVVLRQKSGADPFSDVCVCVHVNGNYSVCV